MIYKTTYSIRGKKGVAYVYTREVDQVPYIIQSELACMETDSVPVVLKIELLDGYLLIDPIEVKTFRRDSYDSDITSEDLSKCFEECEELDSNEVNMEALGELDQFEITDEDEIEADNEVIEENK